MKTKISVQTDNKSIMIHCINMNSIIIFITELQYTFWLCFEWSSTINLKVYLYLERVTKLDFHLRTTQFVLINAHAVAI